MSFCNMGTFLFIIPFFATIYVCPEIETIKCGPKDMMCKGGVDAKDQNSNDIRI